MKNFLSNFVVAILVLSLAGSIAYQLLDDPVQEFSALKSNTVSTTESATNKSTITQTKETHPSYNTATTKKITHRADLLNSSLEYPRMPNIHNTVLASDSIYNELKAVILEFNTQCEVYMNNFNVTPPSLLKINSVAYDQQVEYKMKHPDLTQSYQKIDVINAREDNDNYYVWVTETLNCKENGKAFTSNDSWVYRLRKDNGTWYIYDYTTDPAAK